MKEILFLIDRIILSADYSPAFDNGTLYVMPYNEHFVWWGLGSWVRGERERKQPSTRTEFLVVQCITTIRTLWQ